MNVPVVPVTRTESMKSTDVGRMAPLMTESPLTAVWPAGGTIVHPTRRIPDDWFATTSMGTYLFCDASAPVAGESSTTFSAFRLTRKMKSVSWAEFPAPSLARPTIWIKPPTPEFAGKLKCTGSDADLSAWFAKIVSVVSINPPE